VRYSRELEVLATVERGDTISELATKLDHSESYLSRAVGGLVETDDDRSPKWDKFQELAADILSPSGRF
jgi:hypothetical protein